MNTRGRFLTVVLLVVGCFCIYLLLIWFRYIPNSYLFFNKKVYSSSYIETPKYETVFGNNNTEYFRLAGEVVAKQPPNRVTVNSLGKDYKLNILKDAEIGIADSYNNPFLRINEIKSKIGDIDSLDDLQNILKVKSTFLKGSSVFALGRVLIDGTREVYFFTLVRL